MKQIIAVQDQVNMAFPGSTPLKGMFRQAFIILIRILDLPGKEVKRKSCSILPLDRLKTNLNGVISGKVNIILSSNTLYRKLSFMLPPQKQMKHGLFLQTSGTGILIRTM